MHAIARAFGKLSGSSGERAVAAARTRSASFFRADGGGGARRRPSGRWFIYRVSTGVGDKRTAHRPRHIIRRYLCNTRVCNVWLIIRPSRRWTTEATVVHTVYLPFFVARHYTNGGGRGEALSAIPMSEHFHQTTFTFYERFFTKNRLGVVCILVSGDTFSYAGTADINIESYCCK